MTNPIDIRPEHLAIVKQILADTLPPESKCWVFGSRAKWTAKDSSDLDLAIDAGKALTKQQSFTLSDALEESDLPYKVDVVDLHNVSESFRAVIERDKVPLPDSAPLSAFVDQKRGITYGVVQPGQPDPSGVPIIRVNNIRHGRISSADVMRISPEIEKKYQRTRLQGGEVLLTLVGTLGEVAIAGNELKGWNVARAVAVIPPAKNVSAKWLHICLSSAEAQHKMRSRATTTVQATLNLRDVAELPIYIPARKTQDYIEKAVSAIDEKMELNRRMNTTLEAMARALFKSWFVDFIPVRAKMEGRAPDGLSADIAALFPDTLVSSPLGEIPKGWEVKTLAEIVELNPSERIPKDSVAPYLDMAALPTAGFFPEEPRPRKVSSGSRFKNGDTLLARITPCLENGKTAYVTELEEQQIGWGSTEFIVMRPKAPCPPEYGYLLARDENFRTFAIQSMTGSSGRQRVPVEALGRYEIVTPSAPLMEKFAIFVQPMFEKSIAAMRENQTLSQLRDTLLPKLISGQLRVDNIHHSIKEAI